MPCGMSLEILTSQELFDRNHKQKNLTQFSAMLIIDAQIFEVTINLKSEETCCLNKALCV